MYMLALAPLDFLALSEFLEKMNQNERVVLSRVLMQRGFAPMAKSKRFALGRAELRAEAARALGGMTVVQDEMTTTQTDMDDDDNDDDDEDAKDEKIRRASGVGQLRLLIADRITARQFLPSTIRFGADMAAAEQQQNEHAIDILSKPGLDARVQITDLLTKLTTGPTPLVERKSAVRAINDLLQLDLKAAPPPQPAPPGGAGV